MPNLPPHLPILPQHDHGVGGKGRNLKKYPVEIDLCLLKTLEKLSEDQIAVICILDPERMLGTKQAV